jgi:hypothetical protein
VFEIALKTICSICELATACSLIAGCIGKAAPSALAVEIAANPAKASRALMDKVGRAFHGIACLRFGYRGSRKSEAVSSVQSRAERLNAAPSVSPAYLRIMLSVERSFMPNTEFTQRTAEISMSAGALAGRVPQRVQQNVMRTYETMHAIFVEQ